jgi:hypothetical protein
MTSLFWQCGVTLFLHVSHENGRCWEENIQQLLPRRDIVVFLSIIPLWWSKGQSVCGKSRDANFVIASHNVRMPDSALHGVLRILTSKDVIGCSAGCWKLYQRRSKGETNW